MKNLKSIIYLWGLLLFCSSLATAQDKQFPEDGKVYVPGVDFGFDQYQAKSLYHTKTVALTFDDGPNEVLTPKLLDILKKYDVKATFFILTENINRKTLPLIKRIALEGHTIASHHVNHNNNNSRTEENFRETFKKSIKEIAQILEDIDAPHREIYYRFPYGAYAGKKLSYHHLNVMKEVSEELFGENCINFAFWDIDSLDWLADMTQKDVIDNVMANLIGGTGFYMKKNAVTKKIEKDPVVFKRPIGGGVILMHDVHASTIKTMVPMLERFKKEGIEVKPLYDIEEYSYHGKECRLKV